MSDYSTASSNADDAIASSAEGLVEEYEIRNNGRRVKRGRLTDQIDAATKLEGLAARRASGSISRLGKFRRPRS